MEGRQKIGVAQVIFGTDSISTFLREHELHTDTYFAILGTMYSLEMNPLHAHGVSTKGVVQNPLRDFREFSSHFLPTRLAVPTPFPLFMETEERCGSTMTTLCNVLEVQQSRMIPLHSIDGLTLYLPILVVFILALFFFYRSFALTDQNVASFNFEHRHLNITAL